MTEQNNRPPRLDGGTDQPHPAQQPLPTVRRVEGTQPSTESWFTSTNTNLTPNLTPERARPLYTPYTPTPQPGQIPGAQGLPTGLPQRTPGASHAVQGAPRPDARFFQPAPPTPPRPAPVHARLPQSSYHPNPYTAQPRIHPARPRGYVNPAMPPYAAAQVPNRHGLPLDRRPAPGARTFNKKAVLMPLAAMAIASAAIGAFAQTNLGTGTGSGTGFEAQTQQVKAHTNQYDTIGAIEHVGDQDVVDAPEVIVAEDAAPGADLSSAVERATAGGRHSNGNYDGPSLAWTYGGAHTFSGSISGPSGSDETSADPAPAPEPEPTPAPESTPEPAPEPEPEPARPMLGENVIAPALDTVSGVVRTLTGIDLRPAR